MSRQIYISGKFVPQEDAKISVFDHGLLYGDGVFEGMRSYHGKVFRLKEHLDRLWDSARSIWLNIPITPEEMATAVNDTLAKNNIRDGYIRLIVTRGAGTLGHTATEIPSGKYVSAVTIVNPGTIRIAYSNAGGFQANANLNGFVLDMRPALSGAAATGNNDVVWVCGNNAGPTAVHQPATAAAAAATTVPNKYLPASCRP